MNKKIKILSLFGLLCLSAGTISFNNIKPSVESAIAEGEVDWQSWTLKTTQDSHQVDAPQTKSMVSLQISSGSTGMFYASGATVVDGKSDSGYLNNHRPQFGDGTNNLIDYITINGRAVSEIIDENIKSNKYKDGTAFSVFGNGGKYAPVLVEANHNVLNIRIMTEYLIDMGLTMHEVYVGFKAGAPFRDSSYTVHTLNKDISAVTVCRTSDSSHFAEVKTAESGLDYLYVKSTLLSKNNRGMKTAVFYLSRPLTAYSGSWILNHDLELSAFLTLNGKSIQEWNGSIDDSTWDYTNCEVAGGAAPSNYYNRPISINVNSGDNRALYVSFHDNFLPMLKDGEQVTLGIKKGFSYQSGETMYYQSEDTANAFIYNEKDTEFKASLPNRETLAGNASYVDMQVTSISNQAQKNYSAEGYYGVDIKFNKSFDKFSRFDVFDGNDSLNANKFTGNYITVNGVSVEDINKTVDDSGYDYSTLFPQNANEFYAKPIVISRSAPDTLTLVIHGNYVATLGDSITVDVAEGLTIYNATKTVAESTYYTIDGIFRVSSSASKTVSLGKTSKDTFKELDTKWMLSYDYSSENGQFVFSNVNISFGALVEKEKIDTLTSEYSISKVGVDMRIFKTTNLSNVYHSNSFEQDIAHNDFSSLRTDEKSKTNEEGDYYSWYGLFTMLNKNASDNQSWLTDYKFQAQAYVYMSGEKVYLAESEQVSISDLAYKYVQSGVTAPSVVALAKLGHPEVGE